MTVAERHGMEGDVLDEKQITEKEMGGLLAIGKANVNPPLMIVIKYQGTENWDHVIGLVGKGILEVHFDIAGTAYLSKERGVDQKGVRGTMVRTITDRVLTQESSE